MKAFTTLTIDEVRLLTVYRQLNQEQRLGVEDALRNAVSRITGYTHQGQHSAGHRLPFQQGIANGQGRPRSRA